MYPEVVQFKTWLKCQYPHSSASIHYSSDLALFFSFVKKLPAKITSKDVDHYISRSLKEGKKPATINRRLSALRTFYYYLSIIYDVSLACPVLPRHRLRKSYPLPRDVEDTAIQALFKSICSPRDRAMFLLMLECGLRVGEVRLLCLEDVCLENSPQVLLVHGKGGRQRIVYLSQRAQDALVEWLNSRPVSKDRAVFISEHGKRLSVAGIQYLLRCYCAKAGVRFTCHQLRHTFGRRMAEVDLPLTSLQSMLGHKSVRTTQIYVHLSNVHLHAEYDKAISHSTPSHPLKGAVRTKTKRYLPKPKEVNWDNYLHDLPKWLVDLIRAYCLRPSQANDPIQQTRNRLTQFSRFFRYALVNDRLTSLSDLTPQLWFSYVERRLEAGIQPTSLNTALRTLQSFLNLVREAGNKICDRMREIRPLQTGETLPRAITWSQLNSILEQADTHDYAWILLMAHSGLRTCEIRSLRWSDLDLQRRTNLINESKALRSRVIFLGQPTLEALKQLPKTSDHVFTNNNQPLNGGYCQSRLRTLGKKFGIHVTPHQLRHTCGSILLNAGMSIFGVKAILGHKYIDTTIRYARTYDTTVAKEYEKATNHWQKSRSPNR
jgi:site-specific recombinase XerD